MLRKQQILIINSTSSSSILTTATLLNSKRFGWCPPGGAGVPANYNSGSAGGVTGSCNWGGPASLATSRIAGGGTYKTPYHQAISFDANYGSEYPHDKPNHIREAQRDQENTWVFNIMGLGVVMYVMFLSAEMVAKGLANEKDNEQQVELKKQQQQENNNNGSSYRGSAVVINKYHHHDEEGEGNKITR